MKGFPSFRFPVARSPRRHRVPDASVGRRRRSEVVGDDTESHLVIAHGCQDLASRFLLTAFTGVDSRSMPKWTNKIFFLAIRWEVGQSLSCFFFSPFVFARTMLWRFIWLTAPLQNAFRIRNSAVGASPFMALTFQPLGVCSRRASGLLVS